VLSIILVMVASVSAVVDEDSSTVAPVTSADSVVDSVGPVVIDTLLYVPDRNVPHAADVTNPINLEEHLSQKPTVALFKSMLVPGLGQLGNRRYTKAMLFAGLEIWFIASSLHYASDARDARRAYTQADDLGVRSEYYNIYDNERTNRNKFAWYAGLTIFISMFDAYVDAHLSGSPANPRNDDITVNLKPADNGGVEALLTYRF
jgi:hypothetical protein